MNANWAFRALAACLLLAPAAFAAAFETGRSDETFLAQVREARGAVESLSPARSGLSAGDVFTGTVSRVFDADTVLVAPPEAVATIVRLEAVDAPEVAHPERDKPGQPYGDEAAEFLRRLCLGKTVKVTVKEVDKYGRLIGWVELSDGRALQRELLREGWAWWNLFFSKDQALNDLENEAIKAGRGLWAGKAIGGDKWPEAPWVFRRRVEAGLRRLLPGDSASFTVTHMPDGDTAALGTRHKVYDYVRLAGIDAPEVSHGQNKPGQPYGPQAAERATALVKAAGMRIEVEVEDVDAYGRIVAWVRLPSRAASLNEILLDEGFAWWYERYYPHRDDLRRRQEAARAARRGLWADPDPVPPWDFRRRDRSVN